MTRPIGLDPEMNDIIFEGRNKSYGAYILRHDYEGNMSRAMLAGSIEGSQSYACMETRKHNGKPVALNFTLRSNSSYSHKNGSAIEC